MASGKPEFIRKPSAMKLLRLSSSCQKKASLPNAPRKQRRGRVRKRRGDRVRLCDSHELNLVLLESTILHHGKGVARNTRWSTIHIKGSQRR